MAARTLTLRASRVVHQRAALGEAPIWDRRRASLLWVDVLGSQLFEYDPTTDTNTARDLRPHTRHVSTVVPCCASWSASKVVLAVTDGFALYDLETGEFEPHRSNPVHDLNNDEGRVPDPAGEPELGAAVAMARMNDGKCDPQGRLWAGSLVRDGNRDLVGGAAALYLLRGWAAEAELAMAGVTCSNGLAWDREKMCVWCRKGRGRGRERTKGRVWDGGKGRDRDR
jgi:sugar lactone lactonase YvrE